MNIKADKLEETIGDIEELDRVKLLLGQAMAVLQLEKMVNSKFIDCAQLIVMASGDNDLMELWNLNCDKAKEAQQKGMKAIRAAAEKVETEMKMESVEVNWLN